MRSFGTKVIAILLFSSMALFAQNISIGGTWNSSANWSLGHVPTAAENVVINTNMAMDVSSAALGDITVNSSFTLNTNGNALDVVNATINGSIVDLAYATTRNFQISGNLAVSGTLSWVSTVFDGSADQVVSGSGTIEYYVVEFSNTGGAGVEVSNSTSTQKYYELVVSNGTFEPSNSWTTDDVDENYAGTKINITGGTLTAQSNCTFYFSGSHDGFPPPVGYSTVPISNSASTTTTFQNIEYSSTDVNNSLQFAYPSGSNTVQVNGFLTFNGAAKGGITVTNCSIAYGAAGGVKYATTGTVDSDEWPAAGVPNIVLQSGTVTVPTGTFEVDSKLTRVNGSVSLTGSLQFDSANETTLEYAPSPAAAINVGDEWPTGSTTRPSNVTINNSGQTVTVSATARVIPKTLTLTAGSLAMGSNNLTILGSIASSDIVGSGAVTSSATIFADDGTTGTTHYNQTISGSVTLANLTVNKAQANNDLTITGSPTISGALTITNGDVIVSSSGALTVNTMTLSNSSSFTTGGKTISGLTSLTASSSSTFQFNGTSLETTPLTSVTFGNVNMNNSAGLNINGTVTVNGQLTFSQDATVNTSAANTLVIGSTGSVSGNSSARFVNGPLQKAFATGVQSFVYPVGYSSTYHPATFDYLSNSVATSIVQVEAVSGAAGGTTPSGISSIATSHYYKVTEQGTAGSFTYNFTGHYSGTGFTPETRNQLIRQSNIGPVYVYDNSSTQTVNTTDKTVKVNDALSALPTDDGIFAFGAGGAAVTWTGTTGSWATGSNWSSGSVPSSADDVTIDVDGITVTIGSSTSAAAQSLTVGGGAGTSVTLVISSTSTSPLTVTNAFTLASEGVLTFSASNGDISAGSTSFNAASLVEYQSRTIPADTYGNLLINGATAVGGATGTVSVQGALAKSGPDFTAASGYPFLVSGDYINSSGVATFNGGVTINGASFDVSGGSVAGNITLSRTTGSQTIDGAGTEITFSNLTLNNSNGLALNNPVRINGTLQLTSGLVTTTEANLLTIGTAGSVANYDDTHYINGPMANSNTSTMVFPIGKDGEFRAVTLLYSTGSAPTVRFEMFSSNPAGIVGTGLTAISTMRYWKGQVITGSFTGNVQLHWGDNDGVDGATTDLAVAQSITGITGTYNSIGNKNRSGDATSGWVQSSDGQTVRLSAADYFTLGSATGDNSLPVELASFTATSDYGRVTLDWATASELNNLGFNIYRRELVDQDAWTMINDEMIDGQGSTSQETNYVFVDSKVVSGETYVYKLESVSLDGFRVDEKMVEVTVLTPEEYVLYNNYPNPFNPSTTIRFLLPETQEISLVIYDARGRIVRELLNRVEMQTGEHQVSWNAVDQNGAKVSSGMYFYRFNAGSFNKMGKMILLK